MKPTCLAVRGQLHTVHNLSNSMEVAPSPWIGAQVVLVVAMVVLASATVVIVVGVLVLSKLGLL